jgi:hypothetical protein
LTRYSRGCAGRSTQGSEKTVKNEKTGSGNLSFYLYCAETFHMDKKKSGFIQNETISRLNTLSTKDMGKWGKMNAQQMVEHVSDFFKVSSGKIVLPLSTPVEVLPKYKEFLMGDREFRENTRAPVTVVPEEPFPARHPSFSGSVNELRSEIDAFITYFKDHPDAKTVHPVFGELDYGEWVLLHYKHVTHHLRQFGVL